MKIAIYKNKDKYGLVSVNEINRDNYLMFKGEIYCPSCGTPLKLVIREDMSKEFIADSEMMHDICNKEYRKNFFQPLKKEYFRNLSNNDIKKYLKVMGEELVKIIKCPTFEITKKYIMNMPKVKLTNVNTSTKMVIEVYDILSFIKKPKKEIFLAAEVKGVFSGEEFMYIDLLAGKSVISIHLKGRVYEAIKCSKVEILKDLASKDKRYAIAMYVADIREKNNGGINIIVSNADWIKIVEIK